jgi:predicted DNA binding protein
MTVVVEFTLAAEAFLFGRSTSGDPDVRVQLERVVPVNQNRIPFLWATSHRQDRDFEAFEDHLRDSEIVTEIEALTRVDDSVLYYVEWYENKEAFLNGLSDAGGAIMEAHGDKRWSFTVRFRDHTDLTRFHQFYQARDFPVRLDRVYAPDDDSEIELGFGLTPEQQETLLLAVEKGYFSVPRGTTLDEIAEAADITRQAASERVRRGTETALRKCLLGLVAEGFDPADDSGKTAVKD